MLIGHTFPGSELADFTECHWSTPPQILDEVTDAGFELLTYAGVQGFASGMAPQMEVLAANTPEVYSNVVEVAAETSQLIQYRDITDHLHVVARKTSV